MAHVVESSQRLTQITQANRRTRVLKAIYVYATKNGLQMKRVRCVHSKSKVVYRSKGSQRRSLLSVETMKIFRSSTKFTQMCLLRHWSQRPSSRCPWARRPEEGDQEGERTMLHRRCREEGRREVGHKVVLNLAYRMAADHKDLLVRRNRYCNPGSSLLVGVGCFDMT